MDLMNGYYKSNENLHGIGIIEDISNTIKDIGKAINKIKDIGKPAPGLHHRKLASAINYFAALGYSTAQMQQEPLRTIIATVGGYAARPIKEIAEMNIQSSGVRAPLFYGPGHSFEKYILSKFPQLPPPQGRPSVYQIPPDGSSLDRIVRQVFGPIPGYGVTLTLNDLYAYAPGVQQTQPANTATQTPTYSGDITSSYASGGNQNNTPPPPPPEKQANMGLIIGIGVAALGFGIMAGMPQKKSNLSGTKRKTTKRKKRKS